MDLCCKQDLPTSKFPFVLFDKPVQLSNGRKNKVKHNLCSKYFMPHYRKQLFSFLAELLVSEFAVEEIIDPELSSG